MARTLGLRFRMLVVAIALVAGCSAREQPRVVWVEDEDPSLRAATAQARKTVDEFIARLEKPAAPESFFSVKVRLQEGRVVEHLWLGHVRFDGQKFTGTLDNNPDWLARTKAGSTHEVAPDQISDWMIMENNRLIGGYTIRALRDKVPPVQRVKWDQALGFSIDEPVAEPAAPGLRSTMFDSVTEAPEEKGAADE